MRQLSIHRPRLQHPYWPTWAREEFEETELATLEAVYDELKGSHLPRAGRISAEDLASVGLAFARLWGRDVPSPPIRQSTSGRHSEVADVE